MGIGSFRILEAIGPSCSGKTTLIRRTTHGPQGLKANREISDRLWTRRDITFPLEKDIRLDSTSLQCLRIFLPGVEASALYSSTERSTKIRLRAILEDNLIRADISSAPDRLYLLDSGICKCFYRRFRELPKQSTIEILRHRAILLHSVKDPATLRSRIKERLAKGDPVTAYRGMTESDIRNKIQRKTRELEMFAAMCQDLGVVVIRTHAEDPIEASSKVVRDYVLAHA